jgi:ligand-binding sensor protein
LRRKTDTYLVDEKYSIRDLVDLKELQKILERFSLATGFTIGFIEHPSLEILIATSWRDICTKFHRACPKSLKNCLRSNKKLIGKLKRAGQLVIEECDNALVDCATPIIIKGKHIATLATGQVLLKKPDIERFQKQARTYGYDVDKYLKALNEVPVVSRKQLKNVTSFLSQIAMLIADLGLINMEIKEHAVVLEKAIDKRKQVEETLRERETFIRTVLDNLPMGIAVNSVDPSVNFEYMNDNFPRFYRTTRQSLTDPDTFWKAVYEDPVFREEIRKRVLDDCSSGDPARMRWEEVPIKRTGEKTTFINAQNIQIPNKHLMISMVWDVTERKQSEEEINKRIKELEDFYDMAVGRELRMKELKVEIKTLKEELERYKKS